MSDSNSGLRGVVAAETAICTVGDGHGLGYRGYAIGELAAKVSFEEVAYLLLRGELPTRAQLADYHDYLISLRGLPASVTEALELLPATAHPMDVCRVGVAHYGVARPEGAVSPSSAMEVAERLLANLPVMLCHWHSVCVEDRAPAQSGASGIAAAFLETLHGKPVTIGQAKALDKSLILYAEHELNASTFTARIVAATLADTYSAIGAALGALKGPLHGGANEAAMEMIEGIADERAAVEMIEARTAAKEMVMGFGHAVYKSGDPRSPIIKEVARSLAQGHPKSHLFAVSEAIEKFMAERKGIYPNLDFYCASAYHFLGIPTGLFTPLFACARLAGWGAHIMEQRGDNRLIRPDAKYVGPGSRAVAEINERG